MPLDRKRRILLPIAVALSAAALVAPMPFGVADRLLKAFEDAVHIPVFAVFGYALWRVRPRFASGLALLAALAAGVELAQVATGRDPSWRDALFSALGGSVGLLWGRACEQRAHRMAVAWTLVCALIAWAPAAGVILDRRDARAAFPVLADFSTQRQLGRWTARGVRVNRIPRGGLAGRDALRMRVARGDVEYPGVFLSELAGDWTAFTHLCVNIHVEDANPPIVWVRVDDREEQPVYRDRAQEVLALRSGWNELRLELDALLRAPSGRALDRGSIARLGFFFDAPAQGAEIRIDHLRLEGKP